MKFELTDQECDVLLELMETAHRGRILELHRTDSLEYKLMLQGKVRIIDELIARLSRREATATRA